MVSQSMDWNTLPYLLDEVWWQQFLCGEGKKSLDNSMSQVEVVDIKILPENHKNILFVVLCVS